MTKQDRQLLLKDLCSRLPYGIKVEFHTRNNNVIPVEVVKISKIDSGPIIVQAGSLLYSVFIENIKPYLRPMSFMTEKEEKEYQAKQSIILFEKGIPGERAPRIVRADTLKSYDWLIEHHFDYRGLIEKGLALEAKEGMYAVKK